MANLTANNINKPGRILLNTQMIADDLTDMGWSFLLNSKDKNPSLKGFELYDGQKDPDEGVIYMLPRGKTKGFPVDRVPYITAEAVFGAAPHIRSVDRSDAEILNAPTDFLNSLNVNGICADAECLSDVFSGAGCQSLALDYAHVPVGPDVLNRREEFEDRWKLKIWLNWSHPAFFGAGMANECYLRGGLHLQEDAFLFEILNPQTLESVEDGLPGELVVTDLAREAQTLLRFRTGLTAVLDPAPCACGRTGRRVTFISGQ